MYNLNVQVNQNLKNSVNLLNPNKTYLYIKFSNKTTYLFTFNRDNNPVAKKLQQRV